MEGYKATLKEGQEIYIPRWGATIQYENLTQACKYLGQDRVMQISTLNYASAMLAIMGSDDAKGSTELVMHFVQQCRIDGKKIDKDTIEEFEMNLILELFTHVMYSQYYQFFESGLVKASSPPK